KEVFVDPQPPLRLPYNWYVRSRPAAAGVAKEEAAKRRHAKVAATRIRRRRVDMASHPMVGRRDVLRHKSIGLNGRMVRDNHSGIGARPEATRPVPPSGGAARHRPS